MQSGTRHLLHITATPAVVAGNMKSLTKQFYISVDNNDDDGDDGMDLECNVVSDTYLESCQRLEQCSDQLWHATLQFSAPVSGVRDVMITPTSHPGHYLVDNFIIGTQLEHELYWTGDCCTHHLGLVLTDTSGHHAQCQAGLSGPVDSSRANTAMITTIIVVTIMLIVVIIVCVIIVLVIRRKRIAQLEYLRQLPG